MVIDISTDQDGKSGKMKWKVRDLIITGLVMFFLGFIILRIIEHLGLSNNSIVGSSVEIIILAIGIALLYEKYPLKLFADISTKRVLKYSLIGVIAELLFNLPKLTISPQDLAGVSKHYATFLKLGGFDKIFYLFFLCLLGPTFEEILYRGFVYRILRNRYDIFWGALISSALFAVIHFYGYDETVFLGITALFYVYLYEKSESILPPIVAHATGNTLLFAFTYWALRGH